MKSLKLLVHSGIILLVMIATSCMKDMQFPVIIEDMKDLKVDPDFTFQTSKPVSIKVTMLDNNNGPVAGMRVDIYTAHPDSGGKRLTSGITDAKGVYELEYSIPAYANELTVGTDAIGFVNMQTLNIESGKLNCTLGGKQEKKFKNGGGAFYKSLNSLFIPMGTYNSSGVPNYLEPQNDIIDASMIQDINATMPEYQVLPNTHPQYFDAANVQNLLLNEASNVWVTFVHEGAGYKNVLGYYTYTQGDVPASVSDIDSIHIIYPNNSFQGSGGGLTAGNKVYLGQFPPGISIGWVLIADGFRNQTITTGNWIFYSDKHLNPETSNSKKQHFVFCNDIGRGKFLLGVEDIKRDQSSDNDFNDAVFYVTADPIQAVDVSRMPLPYYTATDTDQDGISDNFDDYPSDANKAFNNYYPKEGETGSLAFEDLWPSIGDYDFNDMVIDYNINQVTNGQNKVVGIQGKYILRAIGAGYESGFGFQVPVSPNVISSFTGYRLTENMINLAPNGTENGQAKATFILFENAYKILPHTSGTGVNTTIGVPYSTPDTISFNISFTTPQALSAIGSPPYNPFIFVNGDRSREVHLINLPPTSLANMSLFGTGSDDSDPASGRYYVSHNNLPWGLNTVDRFDYPAEKIPIIEGHNKFAPWSVSSGMEYYDWFLNITGYRNSQNLYHY